MAESSQDCDVEILKLHSILLRARASRGEHYTRVKVDRLNRFPLAAVDKIIVAVLHDERRMISQQSLHFHIT